MLLRTLLRRVAVVALFLGGLAYADWVLQLFLPISTSPVTSYISELSANGQPFADVFRLTDTASGLLIVAGAAAGWWLTRRWWPTWLALGLLGASNVMEAMSPMRCVITFAAACTPPVKESLMATIFNPHAWVSVLQTLSCFFLLAAGTLALRRAGAHPALWRILGAVAGLAIFVSLIEGGFTVELLLHSSDSVLGLIQRIEVSFTGIWLALVPGLLMVLGRDRIGAALSVGEPNFGRGDDRRERVTAA